jgi:hypothetical protein
MSCPTWFTEQNNATCTFTCPSDFKTVIQNDKVSCVLKENNAYFVDLVKIPNSAPQNTFINEKNRVNKSIFDILKQLKSGIDKKKEIEGQYLGNKEYSEFDNKYTEIIGKLTPFRPPTAPSEDLEKERRAIEKSSAIDLLVIQIVLFGIITSLIIYLIVPMDYAHSIVFLVLIGTISVGIFLKK